MANTQDWFSNSFEKPNKPFLLIYTVNKKMAYEWFETETQLQDKAKQVTVLEALEIGKCRTVCDENERLAF